MEGLGDVISMRSENVLFFPFNSYFNLKRLELKDQKDHYLHDVFREGFFAHKPVTVKLEYLEDAQELHYVSVLVGPELAEFVTFVSQTFREVFTDGDGKSMDVDIIPFTTWCVHPFTRSFVELPSPVIFLDDVKNALDIFREEFFSDWEEGFQVVITSQPAQALFAGLEEPSEPTFIYLEKVRVKEYTKEMLREVLEDPQYDLLELNSGEFVFITTREGRKQWEQKFPPRR